VGRMFIARCLALLLLLLLAFITLFRFRRGCIVRALQLLLRYKRRWSLNWCVFEGGEVYSRLHRGYSSGVFCTQYRGWVMHRYMLCISLTSSNERRRLAAVCSITYVGVVSLLAFDIHSIYMQLHTLWDARFEHRVVSRGGLGSCSSTQLQPPLLLPLSPARTHTHTKAPRWPFRVSRLGDQARA